MEYRCELQQQPEQPTLTIRTRTPAKKLPQVMGESYGAIGRYLAELGEQPAGPPFAAYHNMDMDDLDVESGFTVARHLPGQDNIKAGALPTGKNASCIFVGPYVDLQPAYAALAAWIEENEYEATGVAYEFYLNDPNEVPPEELMTQIVFPLKEN